MHICSGKFFLLTQISRIKTNRMEILFILFEKKKTL
jgi:hypothetical protein